MELFLLLIILTSANCQLIRKVTVLINNGTNQHGLHERIWRAFDQVDWGTSRVKLEFEFVAWNTSEFKKGHVNRLQVAHNLICPLLLNQSVSVLLIQIDHQDVAQEVFSSTAYTLGFYRVPVLGILMNAGAELLKKSLYPTFLSMSPSFKDEVVVFVKLLDKLKYKQVILITVVNDVDGQEFVPLFKQLAKNIHIQKHVEIDATTPLLQQFGEATSNMIVLYAGQNNAELIFSQLDPNAQVGKVWLVNEEASRAKNIPVGFLSIQMRLDILDSIQDSLMVLRDGVQILADFNETVMPPLKCKKSPRTANDWTNRVGTLLFNRLAGIKINRHMLYEVVNVHGNNWQKVVGYMDQRSTLSLDNEEIIWPGGVRTKPLEVTLPKHLRCLTVSDPPFVFSFAVANGSQCSSYKNIKIDGVNVLGPWIPCMKIEETTKELTSFCCSGYAVEYLLKLSQMKVHGRQQAFTFDLVLNESYGAVVLDENGGYYLSGMLGELDSGRGDLAVGAISVNQKRKLYVDFSAPWLYSGIKILEKLKVRDSPLESIMQPFKKSLWVALLVSVTFIGVIIYLLDLKSPFEKFEGNDADSLSRTNNKYLTTDTRLTFGESFWFVWGILLNSVTDKTPKSFAARLLGVTWCGFCLIFVASFTAHLAAFLVLYDEQQDKHLGINDQRFRNPSVGYTFATVLHTNTYQYLKQHIELSTVFRKMNHNFKNSRDAINALLNDSLGAFIWDSIRLDFEASKHCDLRTRGPIFGRSAYAIALQKDSPWTEHISTAILKLSEDGSSALLYEKWITNSDHKKCHRETRRTPSRLGLHNIYEIFVMLAAGILIGALMSAAEVWLEKMRQQKMKKNQLAQNYALKWRRQLNLQQPPAFNNTRPKELVENNQGFLCCFSVSRAHKRSKSLGNSTQCNDKRPGSRQQERKPFVPPRLTFGRLPTSSYCSKCRRAIQTIPKPVVGLFAVISSIACILLGLWPCALAPCFLQCFADYQHQCPVCNHVVGRYRRGSVSGADRYSCVVLEKQNSLILSGWLDTMVATNGNSTAVEDLIKKYKDVDPFLLNKWERIFTLFFDRNCSNNVDWGDFYLVIRKVREVYGSESTQINYARKSLETLWKGLCKVADINKDNLITLDEWIQLLRKGKEKEPKWLDEYQAFMFKLFDVSGDGVLDQAEYADGMSIYGFRYKESADTFKRLALDACGKELEFITPAHWKKLFFELFFASDKSRPGNHLFGHLVQTGHPVQTKVNSSAVTKECSLDKTNSVDKPGVDSEGISKDPQ